jgi:hypothetical protein
MSEIENVVRMSRDLAKAAATLSDAEARYLVDAYYMMQENRKRADNQLRALGAAGEPHAVIAWLSEQSSTLEDQIKRALDRYTGAHVMGAWMREIVGIGPVIAAGLLAHIDIEKAPTAGHVWRFAGLDPTSQWKKGEKRPWNAALKLVCWKAGQSFLKFSGREDCYYGKVYVDRKTYEIARNDSGGNAKVAADILASRKIGRDTEAYKALVTGKLPAGQIDARARRYAVKLFLSHLHGQWYRVHFGKEPPAPYPIAHMGHAHMIEPPNTRSAAA